MEPAFSTGLTKSVDLQNLVEGNFFFPVMQLCGTVGTVT